MPLLAFFFCLTAFAAAPRASDPAWRALLHFSAAGARSSVEEGSAFFLSPEGDQNPEAEFRATAALFAADPSAVCRYPARALYFGLKPDGEGEPCDRWRRWRDAISAEGIELVFASAFLSSPSSMYGHTLLKFPRRGRGEELLDYTLNYGADTGTSAGAAYVWKGLTGGFNGRYATAPFYLKVKEYNFVENRDFWVYPLRVDARQLQLLVAHAWELRDVNFPYFFLRKNCSYYLLEFLEVARPGEGLTEAFPLWAVPMDTIRRLDRAGWLGEPRLRPSRYKVLAARKASLGPDEAGIVSELVDRDVPLPAGREAVLLDAAYDLWRYRNEGKAAGDARERQLLLARGRAGASTATPVVNEPRPDDGHRTGRLSLAGGDSRRGAFAELQYRGTLHDLLGRAQGYEPNSELSMGDIRLRWQKRQLFLERLDVLRLRSLAPAERWFPRRAWSFRVGAARAKEMRCDGWRCVHGLLNGGMGAAARLGPFLFFALGELDFELGGIFTPDYRLAAGPSGGVFVHLWPGARVLVEGDYRWRLLGEKRQRRSARAGLNQDIGEAWELRAEGSVDRGEREALLRLGRYF